MRANAILEVGGSPQYTLTEDFALGMEMKKFGWHCRWALTATFVLAAGGLTGGLLHRALVGCGFALRRWGVSRVGMCLSLLGKDTPECQTQVPGGQSCCKQSDWMHPLPASGCTPPLNPCDFQAKIAVTGHT